MQRVVTTFTIFGALLVSATMSLAQGNPRGTAKLMLQGKAISVEYGRPSLKGRTAQQLVGQVPAGEVWRLGADQATTFSTAADLIFGDVAVPKGEYSLWARKEADGTWKLVFNKQHGQWGTRHDASQDVAAAPLKQTKLTKPVEQVTIELGQAAGGGLISCQWGDLGLSAKFKTK